MPTTRGVWFFLTVFVTLSVATLYGAPKLMLIGFTLLFWFFAQWFLFQLRIRTTTRRLRVARTLLTARGKAESIWARQNVEVVVVVRNEGPMELPYVVLLDRLPPSAQLKEGTLRRDGVLATTQSLEIRYHIACRYPGRLRFEGVKVQLADLQGFFTYMTFLRDPHDYRVLPALAVDQSQTSFVKLHNVLPLLGAHRHARPGTSSELLELRDYIPGDPPKTISWKISARRDRLITREFESEVPIRCTLFLDVSNSVRIGPAGETALGRLVEIAAGIAQANLAERDLTGVCLFDENAVQASMKPGRGARHLFQMLDLLTQAAGATPHTPHARLSDLLPFALGLIQDVYPESLDRDLNSFPAWLPWWAPQPGYTIPRPPHRAAWWRRLKALLLSDVRELSLPSLEFRRWRLSSAYRREYRWRKMVAAVLAVRYDLGPGGLALLLEDDQLCVEHLQRFLAEHQFAYPYPFYDEEGRYLFAAAEKTRVLAQALLRSVTQGRENELFVLCVDLLDLSERMAELVRAVCVAKARHHQVVVICPWPAVVDPPGGKARQESPRESLRTLDLQRLLMRASAARLQQDFTRVNRAFGRIGVPVICAAQKDSVAWILQHMRRLRIQERGVR